MKDRKVRNAIQHKLNPLHLFCRLRRAGMRPAAARRLCAAYERCLYHPLCSWGRVRPVNRAG
jgi:hypothetical protein